MRGDQFDIGIQVEWIETHDMKIESRNLRFIIDIEQKSVFVEKFHKRFENIRLFFKTFLWVSDKSINILKQSLYYIIRIPYHCSSIYYIVLYITIYCFVMV